jgi:glyoxylate reductase
MKIFVTRQIPGNTLEKLKAAGHEVAVSSFDRPLTREELVQRCTGMDAVLSLLTDKIDGEFLDKCGPQLKVVSNYAVGFDNIDVKAATDRGVVVANTPSDEVNEAVAEHAWAFLFALARRVVEADEATKRGAYKGWEPSIFLGTTIAGKTLGIVGLGSIGSMVARKASAFQMKVLYNKRKPEPQLEKALGITFAPLDDLLAKSDFVSLHVPLTEETRHMINMNTLAKFKPGSYLINTARGAIVNEQHLVDSLRSGHLAGAALDVFDNEPNINPELVGMENVILTPHIASATHEAREKMGIMAVDAIINCLNNEKPYNMVNVEVWEKRRK